MLIQNMDDRHPRWQIHTPILHQWLIQSIQSIPLLHRWNVSVQQWTHRWEGVGFESVARWQPEWLDSGIGHSEWGREGKRAWWVELVDILHHLHRPAVQTRSGTCRVCAVLGEDLWRCVQDGQVSEEGCGYVQSAQHGERYGQGILEVVRVLQLCQGEWTGILVKLRWDWWIYYG